VLTEVKAYSAWQSAPTLLLDENGRPETDLIQIRNIEGLDPVKASVNTSPYGSVPGESYVGSSVPKRNIVLTVGLNPDWDDWTYEKLRRMVYHYFTPSMPTRLVFYSDDIVPVEIVGVVESVENNQFSKDPELIVSVICPDPYFTALEPVVLTGLSAAENAPVTTIDYAGSVEAGIYVKVTHIADPTPDEDIGIQLGLTFFGVHAVVDSSNYFEMSSIPMQKYVQNINLNTGVITNLLSQIYIQQGSLWPMLQPGENEFSVYTDVNPHDWELTYFERFGGL
jgi:phage-related protein